MGVFIVLRTLFILFLIEYEQGRQLLIANMQYGGLFLVLPVVPDILDVVVFFQQVDELLHIFNVKKAYKTIDFRTF